MRRLAVLATTAALLTAGLVAPSTANACTAFITGPITCVITAIILPKAIVEVQGATTSVGATAASTLAVASNTLDQATARTLNQDAAGQILPSEELGKMNIALECSAAATPNPVAVGIEQCYLLGANGARYNATNDGAMPGAVDASLHAVLKVPTQDYRVCVQSQAFFQDNVLLRAPGVCSS